MPIVRAQQPALTRILPHPQNRRIAVPNRGGPGGISWLTTVAEGDSVFRGGGIPNGISPAVYWNNPQDTTNEAVGGSTIGDMLARIPTSLTNNPDADYLIHCGGNSASQGDSLATMQADTQSVLTLIENAGRRLAWVKIPPVSNSPNFTAGEWQIAKDWNAWAETELTSRGHTWIDTWPALEDPSNPEETLPAYLFPADPSLVHLSDAGAQAEALVIDQAVAGARLRLSA